MKARKRKGRRMVRRRKKITKTAKQKQDKKH